LAVTAAMGVRFRSFSHTMSLPVRKVTISPR
jgi:hypothetical protein